MQGEGLSPPGLVAGLSGEGSLSLGAGQLLALTSDPLRKVALTAANKTIKADKEEIEADVRAVRDTLTKGTFYYAPAQLRLRGQERHAPPRAGNAFGNRRRRPRSISMCELASLKLDSEWVMSLTGKGSKDVPPVTLVFAGSLSAGGAITFLDRYRGDRGLISPCGA